MPDNNTLYRTLPGNNPRVMLQNRYQSLARRWLLLPAAALMITAGCGEKAPPPPVEETPAPVVNDAPLAPATLTAWQLGDTYLTEAQTGAGRLCEAVQQLLAQPDADNQTLARQAWHRAHNDYHRFDIFRALAGSNPGLFGELAALNSPIDTWPIMPGYLDYFDVYTHSGIVNDIAVPITASAIRRQHGFSDNTDVSLGLHAIAYLLWGEGGQRPPADFAAATEIPANQRGAGISVVDLPNNRRRDLIALMCNLLGDDLASLQQRWSSAEAAMPVRYRQLLPQSRLQLLQQAAQHFLTQDLIARQLTPLLQDTGDPAEAVHSFYAGDSARAMAAGIEGLQQLLLTANTGLAIWLLEEEPRAQLTETLAKALTLLQTTVLHGNETTQKPAVTELRDTLAAAASLIGPERPGSDDVASE
ncbi:hypothetical protein FKG94_14875 [Exilibacterium tricleocarpae]|uniref:Imelysin-like domain-containing protein n=1 Tax=Exilibacterium tricleocarpae TaxID=2591008 RepID=A0A545TK91_9GAMM|nr:imelysin family protein [Exilibacterium tricleocarpae]TQV77627.1 hypothetical protein FKG94_14875 [Exilibacterium tricleocarpae]